MYCMTAIAMNLLTTQPPRLVWSFLALGLILLAPPPYYYAPSFARAGTPAAAEYFSDQIVDHTSPTRSDKNRTWTQRYYTYDKHFQGPGSPIFVILGGEGAIEPSTGLLYPFVTEHLAKQFGAFVLQPEHRFYGASQPVDPDEIHKRRQQDVRPDPRVALLTYEQALWDAVRLLFWKRTELGCSADRFSQNSYCPVIAVGGSYPGFLAVMARLTLPHVFDMAYAASAPVRFYAQQVSTATAYYDRVAQVAERAVPGCAHAVRSTLGAVAAAFRHDDDDDDDSQSNYHSLPPDKVAAVGICPGSVPDYCRDTDIFLDELFMVVGYTFANLNMAYYPPSNQTRLHHACETFLSDDDDDDVNALERLRQFLIDSLADDDNDSCFHMNRQLPSGPHATISSGDWSGVGTGLSGESWDFQTCTLCVEAIGFNSTTSGMFPDRPWSLEWLTQHCQSRFGVTPQPYQLVERWHIDDLARSGATHILFTNGLNDGWSVSGIQHNLSETLVAINFPNGAHHSDLSGRGPSEEDTPDLKQGFVQVRTILATWLAQLPSNQQQGKG